VRFSVRDGAAARHFPLHDHVRDRARKAKEEVGQWRHHGQRNGRKKRECRRPLNAYYCCLPIARRFGDARDFHSKCSLDLKSISDMMMARAQHVARWTKSVDKVIERRRRTFVQKSQVEIAE
jgi:hypothetical protein